LTLLHDRCDVTSTFELDIAVDFLEAHGATGSGRPEKLAQCLLEK
jgi:hypothetical protein